MEGVVNEGPIPRSVPLLLVSLTLSRANIRALAIPVDGLETALDGSVAVRSVLVDPGSTTMLMA